MQIQSIGSAGLYQGRQALENNKTRDLSAQWKAAQAKAQMPSPEEDKKLKAVCRDMEAVFLNMMLTRMRATVPRSKLLGDTAKEEVFQSLLDGELSKNMAQAGGAGLADLLYHQLVPAGQMNNRDRAPR